MNKKIDLNKGKEIFYKCKCSHFNIDMNGEADEYRKCNVPASIEELWRREFKQELYVLLKSKKINERMSALSDLLQIVNSEESFNLLFDSLKEQWDTFSRIILCEQLKHTKKFCKDKDIILKLDGLLYSNKHKMLNEPIIIDDSYINDVHMRGYDFSKENILQRINRL